MTAERMLKSDATHRLNHALAYLQPDSSAQVLYELNHLAKTKVFMNAIDNPFLESLGVTLAHWQPDYAEMKLEVAENHKNRIGRIQGGLMCTLLDAVCGYAGLYVAPGEQPLKNVTLSLTTNFLSSGEGNVLIAKGFVERKGRSIYFARGEVWLDSSLLLSTGVGTFKYIR